MQSLVGLTQIIVFEAKKMYFSKVLAQASNLNISKDNSIEKHWSWTNLKLCQISVKILAWFLRNSGLPLSVSLNLTYYISTGKIKKKKKGVINHYRLLISLNQGQFILSEVSISDSYATWVVYIECNYANVA